MNGPASSAFVCLPGPPLAPFRAVQDLVDRLVGGKLDRSKAKVPHVTMVYYGDVARSEALVAETRRFASAEIGRRPVGTQGFRAFRQDDGGSILVLDMERPFWLIRLREELFRATRSHCVARQFSTWEPHLTLGTVPPGTDLEGLVIPEGLDLRWEVDQLEVHGKGYDPVRCRLRTI